MDVVDSEQFLRQQLSYTRLLVARMDLEDALPTQRALRQSAVLCLDLGLSQYFSSIFNLTAGDMMSLKRRLVAESAGSPSSVPSSEFIELMSEGHWLFEFASVAASLSSLPSAWNKTERSLGGVKNVANTNVIASSSESDRVQHWSEISVGTLQAWLAKAGELLDRHSSFNQEY